MLTWTTTNSTGFSEGINLRQETIDILYGTNLVVPKGHWIVFRRFDRSTNSEFYNKPTKEGVGGPKNTYTEELIRTRHYDNQAKRDTQDEVKVGGLLGTLRTYYFDFRVVPKVGDVIYELNHDDHAITPVLGNISVSDKWVIKAVHPYRIDNGNIAYYSCATERDMVKY